MCIIAQKNWLTVGPQGYCFYLPHEKSDNFDLYMQNFQVVGSLQAYASTNMLHVMHRACNHAHKTEYKNIHTAARLFYLFFG